MSKKNARLGGPGAGTDLDKGTAPSLAQEPACRNQELKPDTAAAVEFLAKWGAPWVLTWFHPDQKATGTRTFMPGDEAELERWIDLHQGKANIYFHVNPLRHEVKDKAKKSDVLAMAWLHLDIDPRVGEDLLEERARAYELLTRRIPKGVPGPPTVVIDSGRGYQGFWKLREALLLGGDVALAEQEAEPFNIQLERLYVADACHNVDRIMRLPGTINIPTKAKKQKGFTSKTLAKCVVFDVDRLYDLSQFTKAPIAVRRSSSPRRVAVPDGRHFEDVWQLPGLRPEGDPAHDLLRCVIVQGCDLDDLRRWPSRSEALWWVVCEMGRAGVAQEDMLRAITTPWFGISASVLDKKQPEAYAQKQVADALAELDTELERDKAGKPVPSQRNIRVGLRLLGVRLSHDTFADRLLIEGLEDFGPALTDDAVARLYLRMDAELGLRPGKDFFWMVVEDEARLRSFHPVKEYLDALAWDGDPRLDTWLTTYGGAEDTEYTRAVARLALIAAVRRVRRPGCKFDEMPVLESPQGKLKSTALAVLAVQEDWFSDDLPLNADSKVVIERTRGRWLVEAGELKGMRRGEIEGLKSLLSRQIDRARPSYGRLVSEFPRQFVIIGTTNSEQYLRDPTGNRRFWPVRVAGFDIEALRRDRDQLWAEAAERETRGESIRLDPTLWAEAGLVQEERRIGDPWALALGAALGDLEGKLRADDAWTLVGVPLGQRTQEHNDRLGQVMRELGFERSKLRFGGPAPEWCYVRGEGRRRIITRRSEHDERAWADYEDAMPPF